VAAGYNCDMNVIQPPHNFHASLLASSSGSYVTSHTTVKSQWVAWYSLFVLKEPFITNRLTNQITVTSQL